MSSNVIKHIQETIHLLDALELPRIRCDVPRRPCGNLHRPFPGVRDAQYRGTGWSDQGVPVDCRISIRTVLFTTINEQRWTNMNNGHWSTMFFFNLQWPCTTCIMSYTPFMPSCRNAISIWIGHGKSEISKTQVIASHLSIAFLFIAKSCPVVLALSALSHPIVLVGS